MTRTEFLNHLREDFKYCIPFGIAVDSAKQSYFWCESTFGHDAFQYSFGIPVLKNGEYNAIFTPTGGVWTRFMMADRAVLQNCYFFKNDDAAVLFKLKWGHYGT